MYKNILILIFILLPTSIYAHKLLLNVFDNGDNTITIEGLFSTGEPTPGALVLLESLSSGKNLYKKRLPSESELIVIIPKEPYKIILDGGPGHRIIKEGITPLEGYSKESNNLIQKKIVTVNNEFKTRDYILSISYFSAIFIFLMTIFISRRNTNKLLIELQKLKKNT